MKTTKAQTGAAQSPVSEPVQSVEPNGTVTPNIAPKQHKKAKAAKQLGGAALTPSDQIRALVERGLPLVEQSIRTFQAELAAINTDAAYEVKAAADYFVEDVQTGILTNLLSEMESPDYRSDEFAAAVLDGEIEDVPLIGREPMDDKPVNGRAIVPLAIVEVTSGPVAPRQTKTLTKKGSIQ